jgi:hypothetical protein
MVLLSTRIQIIIPSILCFFAAQSLNAAVVIKGDEYAGSGITFSFPVNKIAFDAMDDVLFIGAREAGAGVFSLSGLHSAVQQVQPISAPTISLNNQTQQESPIYNQGIAFLDILEATDGKRSPILVLANDLTRVYLLKDFNRFDNISAFSTAPLFDSNNEVTQQIVGLVGYRGQIRSAALAAVTPSYTGIFGDIGSGFVPITFQQYQQEIQVEGNDQKTVKVVFGFGQVAGGAPFNRSSSVIAITDPVTSISNTVTMEWNRTLQRGYIGMQVVGGAAANDGALSVMIADVSEEGVITLRPFAPVSAFDNADNQIIGGIGASIPLSIQFMANMDTSTGLTYLIVQGGNGTPDGTAGSVYALPIVNARNAYGMIIDPTIHGVLASKNSSVYTFYSGGNPSQIRARRFVTPATTPADTPRATDPAARVGGGSLSVGSVIQSLTVVNDAVIISVDQAPGYEYECQTGMFISRAIYNATGTIQAWTPWERMGGVAEPVFRAGVSIESGNITYFTGADALSINTINRTGWGFGSNPGLNTFAAQINSLYAPVRGGVQGLIDVPFGTPGLNDISLYIVGGNQSVTLAQAGTQTDNQQCPNTGNFASGALLFENGSISQNITGFPQMLTIQGGALSNVGPIVTAAIGVNSGANQGYLFVGGSHGLAVLTAPGGAGWNTSIGLGQNFAGLTNGMAFQMLGDYSFVRNLVVDGNFLYVVSAKKVDRIDLSTAPTFTATTIASATSLVFDPNDTVLDGIFSGKLGILATSKGVFRTSNGNNVSTIAIDDNKYWTTLAVPGSVVPPQSFFVSSTTGFANDFARDNGGMLHLLSAYLGASRARVNRFAVADVSSAQIDDNTVLPIPDGEIEGFNTSFITFNGFRSTYTCDGALSLHSLGRALLVSPYVRTRALRTGAPVPLEDGNGTLIGQVLRSSTCGSWLVAGDFGIRLNE